ncbi:MAG TPA: helix-turn-helix domain-containing protein [Methylomirabilota bacterium]|nr:helix-turn-helix domain-containing protein [Methylomirabilota bacterium]
MNNLLSVKQVAFILKVHPLTIRRYIKEKKLKAVKLGGNIRIMENELENFHKEVDNPTVEKNAFRTYKKIAAKQFTTEDPFLRLQGRAARLKLS